MAGIYGGWLRNRDLNQSNTEIAQSEGRRLLAEVMEFIGISGGLLKQYTKRKVLSDGTVVIASFNGTMPSIIVLAPTQAIGELPPDTINAWIPRGFVVSPVTDAAKFGWGFPIVQDTSSGKTQYDPKNLAPGLDVSRWTAAGPLIDVLVSAVPKAGYPSRNMPVTPIMFDKKAQYNRLPLLPKKGRLDVTYDQYHGDYAAYRPELWAFTDASQNPALILTRRHGYELINTHRAGIGRDPINMPLRGYYSISQSYVNMCFKTSSYAHYNPHFFPNYITPGDRVCKDGVPDFQQLTNSNDRNFYDFVNENLIVSASSFTIDGVDPNGENYGSVLGAVSISADAAFAGWLTSAPHKATIENVVWDGHSSFVDVAENRFWAQNFERRNDWIACGNAYWYSAHEEIPALSWHSPPTMNLSYETWPLALDMSGVSDTRVVSWPLAPGTGFEDNILWTDPHTISDMAAILVTSPGPLTDSSNVFYLSIRNTDSATSTDYEYVQPMLTSAVFMRGRCIGIAPNSALILGAGIQRIEPLLSSLPVLYRLQIIVHDPADNTSDVIVNGGMAVAHCYHVDLDDVAGFACHSENVIKGIRGSPPTSWPWTNHDDPWAWVDDGTITVNTTGAGPDADLLKYNCLWRFNSLGTQAACLREELTLENLKRALYQYHLPFDIISTGPDTKTIQYEGAPVNYYEAIGTARTLLLDYGIGSAPPTLHIEPKPPLSHGFIQIPMGDLPHPPEFNQPTVGMYIFGGHIAVDYHGIDRVYIYNVLAEMSNINMFYNQTATAAPLCKFLAKGPFDAASVPAFEKMAYSGDFASNANRSLTVGVVGVNDFVFAQVVFDLYDYEPWAPGPGVLLPNVNFSSVCWTSQMFVESWRDGVRIDKRSYANAGFFSDPISMCQGPGGPPPNGFIGFVLYQSPIVQPSYAKLRNGDWVYSFQVSPQPGTLQFTGVASCAVFAGNPVCWPNQAQLYGDFSGTLPETRKTVNADVSPITGWCTSSFADQSALQAMTKAEGSNFRFARARVV